MLTHSHMIVQSNLLIAPVTSCLRVSWGKLAVGMGYRLQRYDMILEHITKKHTQTHMQTYTHCPAPPHPQSTTAKPHVSVGINRSAQSSSHPALKSFPEVVLQKPAAEEDKRVAIPQAQRLLSSTQLSPCCPLLLLHSSLIPTFLPSLIISILLLFLSISGSLSYYLSPCSLWPFV